MPRVDRQAGRCPLTTAVRGQRGITSRPRASRLAQAGASLWAAWATRVLSGESAPNVPRLRQNTQAFLHTFPRSKAAAGPIGVPGVGDVPPRCPRPPVRLPRVAARCRYHGHGRPCAIACPAPSPENRYGPGLVPASRGLAPAAPGIHTAGRHSQPALAWATRGSARAAMRRNGGRS